LLFSFSFQFVQLVLGFSFFAYFFRGEVKEYQLFALGVLYIILAVGNFVTTTLSYMEKYKEKKTIGNDKKDK
jgi:asparagine N-glycosylation enzyme membrane subunit Stt3